VPGIALVTDRQHGLTSDDRLLLPVLEEQGFDASVVQWDSEGTDWQRFDLCVLRSCWDYHLRIDEFLHWLSRLEGRGVRTANPIGTVRWNYHKRYLKELEQRGVTILPTLLVERYDTMEAREALRLTGWDEVVIKPCVSASGHRTHRLNLAGAAGFQPEFESMVRDSGALVQPFMREIESEGEWSFVFFGRTFSHAVVKKPREGEFRTQESFGGTFVRAVPAATQILQAEKVLSLVPGDLLYARVDMLEAGGAMLLVELELIEPFLFFGGSPGSTRNFVHALGGFLHGNKQDHN